MGRSKIRIKKISSFKSRLVTFEKRKRALLKKAMELSILCNNEVLLSMKDFNGNCIIYHSTGDYAKYINENLTFNQNVQTKSNLDYESFGNLAEPKNLNLRSLASSKQQTSNENEAQKANEDNYPYLLKKVHSPKLNL